MPLALFLVFAAGATARGYERASSPSSGGTLAFNHHIGQVLPTRSGKTIVSVVCDGASYRSRCRGRIEIVARAETRKMLGAGSLAARPIRLRDNLDGDRVLLLSRRARTALTRRRPLQVTIRLSQPGKPLRTRSALIAIEARASANMKPTRVRHVRSLAGALVTSTYTWDWTIKAGTFKVVPDWRCPAQVPNVAKGRGIEDGWRGYEGLIEADASSGTGYAGFDHAHTTQWAGATFNWLYMQGWPEGGWTYNSIWAPWGENGHFKLKVTCTSTTGFGRNDAAQVRDPHASMFFPWKN